MSIVYAGFTLGVFLAGYVFCLWVHDFVNEEGELKKPAAAGKSAAVKKAGSNVLRSASGFVVKKDSKKKPVVRDDIDAWRSESENSSKSDR